MKILISFIGNNDCFPNEKSGAILTVLENHKFDKLYLLYNHEKYLKPASEILAFCRKNYPKLQVIYKDCLSNDPTNYNIVYPAMYKALSEIQSENPKAKFTISVTSGTPTMHACWLFLKQGKVTDAKLIQVSRESGISEVTFELDDFPKIKKVSALKTELTKFKRENEFLKKNINLAYDEIIGESAEILNLKKEISVFADSEIPIFIQGESGTGKELVAEAIHKNSARKDGNLVKVNCGAIPLELFESEFFGHKKGSFTGANSDKDGKFKLADNGTIFLDEVADLPLSVQVKLLRVLQDGTFFPVGSSFEEKVNVRVISATNKNIEKLVEEGTFREDLFYRLVVRKIFIPPLRERTNDKILIAEKILSELNKKYQKSKIFSNSAKTKILQNQWRGNVRQLKNAVESAFVFPENEISAESLNIIEIGKTQSEVLIPDEGINFDFEVPKKYYEAALKKANGNATQAARLLGLEPHTFRARLKKVRKQNSLLEKLLKYPTMTDEEYELFKEGSEHLRKWRD